MSTTTKVRWHNEGDAGFKARFEDAFVEWFQQNNTFDVEVGSGHEWVKTSITFDDACVLNGLHGTTSKRDPNPATHATVRLSTPSLRAENSWYVLHWRPAGDFTVLQRPDSQVLLDRRRARDKAKKQRQKEREQARQTDKKDNIDDNTSKLGAPTISRRA